MMNVSGKYWFGAFWLLSGFAISTAAWAGNAVPTDPDADYDRLDGTGASGKKVNVIEWEGNLEIHVYPAGSLKGLALKLDKRNKDKPVMVIGYRFDGDPGKQLIRRAILGIDLHDGFKAYRDPSADDYDKIIISNNGLSLAQFKLDPPPTQLYPDGYPAGKMSKAVAGAGSTIPSETRRPAAASPDQLRQARDDAEEMEDSGTIRPFFGHPKANH